MIKQYCSGFNNDEILLKNKVLRLWSSKFEIHYLSKLVYQNFYVVSVLSVLPSRLLLDKKKWWKDDGNHINEEVFSYICLIYGFDFLLVTKGVFIRTHLHQGNNGMDIDYVIDWHGFFRPVRKRASI